MSDDEMLNRQLGESLTPASAEPGADRVARLREQVEVARRAPDASAASARGAHAGSAHAGSARGPVSRLILTLAAAVLVIAGVAVGLGIDAALRQDEDLLARGTAEFQAELSGDDVRVTLEGDAAPEGRIITLRSNSLPVMPAGEYYELWFVDEDAPGETGLISAGTFHPDEEGRTLVVLHAAVDPRLAGTVQITREPADGDPSPSGETVARGDVDLLD